MKVVIIRRAIVGRASAMALFVAICLATLTSCSGSDPVGVGTEKELQPVAKQQTAVINGKEIPILRAASEIGYDNDFFITLIFTNQGEVGDHIRILLDAPRYDKKIVSLTDRNTEAQEREWTIAYGKLYHEYFKLTHVAYEKVHCGGGLMRFERDYKERKYRLVINNCRVKDEMFGDGQEYTLSVNAEMKMRNYE